MFDRFFPDGQQAPVTITVSGEVLNPVPDLLFGQLFEKTRRMSGEIGAEGAWPEARGTWVPGFVDLCQTLAPTVIRWPGGGEADRYDWRWGVDGAPGRFYGRLAQEDGRGLFTTNHVGTDEFLDLARRCGAEPLLVVNVAGFRDCPEVGAALAADWVEYCNAPDDGSNPHGGVDWAAVRAANGHPDPWGVALWELGNEVWIPIHPMTPTEYGVAVRPCAREMLEVDPSIRFIGMGQDGRWAKASIAGVGEALRYLSLHSYSVHGAAQEGLTLQDVWRAALSGPPPHFSEQTASTWIPIRESGRADDLRIAITEWNFNLWFEMEPSPPRTAYLAMCGAASFLHELMRRGDHIGLACQSILAGDEWFITTIRLDPDGQAPPRPWPFHTLMALYRNQHGGERLATELTDCPTFTLGREVGNIEPRGPLPILDVVATRSSAELFVHIISGAPEETVRVMIDASAAGAAPGVAVRRHEIFCPDALWLEPPDGAQILHETTVQSAGGELTLDLPPHSVTVLAWPRTSPPPGEGEEGS